MTCDIEDVQMGHYRQLTREERYQIYVLKREGLSDRSIAQRLRRANTTISREWGRNQGGRGYRPAQADYFAHARRDATIRPRIGMAVRRAVVAGLLSDCSPEQIAGRLRREGLRVSHEWIYQQVLEDKRRGGGLWRHLRCQRLRRKRYGRPARGARIPGRVGIEVRPGVVDGRKRKGDWEADTVVGRRGRGPVVVSLVERRTRYTKLRLVKRGTARAVGDAVVGALSGMSHRKTITADNGLEFAGHRRISRLLRIGFYFAKPYHAWERGTNENTNGLLRQYCPKGSDFGALRAAQLRRAESRLNHRPRKCLGFMTPHEVMFSTSGVALRT